MNDKAIVLVSGGMDSCVTAAIASKQYLLAFLHISYGQRTEKRELKAYTDIADFFNVRERLVVDLGHLRVIGGSSLTDPNIPIEQADLHREGIPLSYVPFRNANMLSVATSWGENINASRIFIGAVEEDSSGYPDCRKVFFDAFNLLIKTGTGTGTRITVETPIIGLSKADIIRKGIELAAPLNLTWSCYQSEDRACGICDSCALRLRGFKKAGVEDPLPYIVRPIY